MKLLFEVHTIQAVPYVVYASSPEEGRDMVRRGAVEPGDPYYPESTSEVVFVKFLDEGDG